MKYKFQDHYFHQAKKQNYLARAVFKLKEIQNKYKIINLGDRVLDLGAAPGSWIQYTSQVVGPKGLVVGVDLKEIDHSFSANVVTLKADISHSEFRENLAREYAPFDVVLSDMAPATSGIRVADSARSALLFEEALNLAKTTLKSRGHFLAKIFQGSEFHDLLLRVKKEFDWVKVVKPDASRKISKEIYILAMRFKKPIDKE